MASLEAQGSPVRQESFALLASLPLEITEQIFTNFVGGKGLSTLAMALQSASFRGERSAYHDISEASDSTNNDNQHRRVYDLIGKVAKKRLLAVATLLESSSISNSGNNNGQADSLVTHAVNWIRSVVDFSFVDETNSLSRMKVVSENLALVDFLEHSIVTFSCREEGQFEWPVWCGQITVDSFMTGSRMRNTASVIITAPMQSPSFIPGCNLIQNHAPSGIFRSEPYNMIPVPPWGRVRALTWEDSHVLRPVASRLERLGQVAVPAGYHNDEILDIRIASSNRARELLSTLSWTPRSSWILNDDHAPDNDDSDDDQTDQRPKTTQEFFDTGLVCVWQDDTMEMRSDRQYISYVIDLMKALSRIQR
uniref:Uncharacterized protein n=1 Tax=Entomoneis paludosa TaxID=265537 RepID=A0A7S2YU61_9STRA|mmetsp:Transcript_9973/g.20625  ORF Transcript_9973/g.20625 Transcript_9973/m.20625 type:complete len:366 (+) Transcript_9973:125-1222(+)|eukprot:CAMPEP_0172459120 /NCGR_PEP_ID=MMETSP1065-20121228/31098_1 /TAXON_ID=265537 /ORGANISM="Amphiprora paludosa, Strain CCMP125" /LENGTH=365 /DNA_ID=CAMNT_0013213691 /DNA_START=75 /DNA_END=1172 /DNA_ORIENTATION=+